MSEFYTNVKVNKEELESLRVVMEEWQQYLRDEFEQDASPIDNQTMVGMAIFALKESLELLNFRNKARIDD